MVSLEDELRIKGVSYKYDSKIKKASFGVNLAVVVGILSLPLYTVNTFLNPYRNNPEVIYYKKVASNLAVIKENIFNGNLGAYDSTVKLVDKAVEAMEADLKKIRETDSFNSYNNWHKNGNKMLALFSVVSVPLFFISSFRKRRYEKKKQKEIESLGIVVTEPLNK
ncbi:hypothetical protein HYX19_02645 [Candidatus Woesearchaeota archaeon]|nr:hypothetical protein [Candidatus Woesearchaeota archaeon]